jgi:hypothetical protein
MYYCIIISKKTTTIKGLFFHKPNYLLDGYQNFGGEEYWQFENANGKWPWQ